MAIFRQISQGLELRDAGQIAEKIREFGIDYERWENIGEIGPEAAPEAADEEILEFYADEIEILKAKGGYVTADVINITPETPGLDAMLNKFNKEHWHSEDEVRFIVKGHGIFHIASANGEVVSIVMEAGDLIRVPRDTRHWFDLCADRTIRAIRLFQDPAGWTPYYTGSSLEAKYEPLCFGPAYIPVKA